MMNVFLESLHQSMDFTTRKFTNTIVIRLPSGEKINLAVDEIVVAKLITEVAGGSPVPSDLQATPSSRPIYEIGEDGVTSFSSMTPSPEPAGPPATSIPLGKPTVTRDEAGNPVLLGQGFQDPATIMGHTDDGDIRDEDGVAQA